MKNLMKGIIFAISASLSLVGFSATLPSDKTVIGFSHYTGWEPYAYIRDFGIMKDVNTEMGTNIDIRFYGTYDASLGDYVGGAIHGVTMTNIDALMLATSVSSLGVISGDTSHGNDGVVVSGYDSCSDLKGEKIYLFTKSVSHYMLDKFLATCGLTDLDVQLEHNSDASDLAVLFNQKVQDGEPIAVVTWNPALQTIMLNPKAKILFSSADIKGEISDWLFVRNDGTVSEKDIEALNEMWYRAMKIMTTRSAEQTEMISFMANYSGASKSMFEQQLKTTRFFNTKSSAKKEIEGENQISIMTDVISFVEKEDLLGDYLDTSEFGVKVANGSVIGDDQNVILEFTSKYVQ